MVLHCTERIRVRAVKFLDDNRLGFIVTGDL